MAGTSILAQLAVQISANTASFNASMKGAERSLSTFTKNFQSAAAAVGVGLGVREIIDFATESAKLAGQTEAVGKAFQKLNDSKTLMAELTTVTGGTVSQLKLMQTAVQAANFGIAIKELPKLLEFATLRAQQTGQSVDYLVQSIILGIGRRSPMILDNLGISLGRLREKLKGVGAESASVAHMTKIVGEIAEEELGKMPGFANNAATAIERLAASFENLKAKIGSMDWLQRFFSSLSKGMDELTGDPLTETINILERFNKVEGYGYARRTSLDDIKDKLRLIIEENSGLEVSQKSLEERFGISSARAKEYADIINDLNLEFKKLKFSREAAAKGEVDPISGMAAGGERWMGRPKVEKTDEQLKAEQKAIDELLKERESAFKRYGISISKINKATFEDLKRYDKQSADLLKTQINNYKALGDSTTKFGEQFGTTMDDAQQVIKSMLASGISLPDVIGRPEYLDAIIAKFAKFGKGVKETAEDISSSFSASAQQGIMDFLYGFEQMAAKEITFGENILNAISNFMRSFGQQLIALGTAKLGLDKLLASLTIPNAAVAIGAIAAGTALVAAAGAIRKKNDLAIQKTVRTSPSSENVSSGLRTMDSLKLQVSGTLTGSGRDLIAVIDNATFDNKFRKGN